MLWRSPDHGLCVVFAELSAPSAPRVHRLARKWCAALRKPKTYLCRINSSQFIYLCVFSFSVCSPVRRSNNSPMFVVVARFEFKRRSNDGLPVMFIYLSRTQWRNKELRHYYICLCFVRDNCVVYLAVEMLPQSVDLSALKLESAARWSCQTYNMCNPFARLNCLDIEMPTVFAKFALSLSAHKITIQRIDCIRRDFIIKFWVFVSLFCCLA